MSRSISTAILAEARLGVAHGRGRVALDRAEVALAVDQRVAHVEVLRHAHERGVDDGFAVRVVVAGGVAGDLGALAVLLVGRQARSFMATRMRRWLGLRPSRTSGRARSTMTLMA